MIKFIKKRWWLVIVVCIILLVLFYQRKSPSSTKKETSFKVRKTTLSETLSLSGQIDAEEHATLRFQTSGRLDWVGVKTGDYVKKYQTIASLDQRELEKNLKKYLNTYMKSRWDFEQTKDDYENKAITEAMQRLIDEAQFDLNNAVIDVEVKDIAFKFANLYAPIEGLVVRVDVPYAGVNVTAAQAEFEIINPKTIYLSATADQTDIVKLKQDMKAEVILDSYPDEKLTGKIYMISFIPKEGETGTVYQIKMVLNVANEDYRIRFGMTGDANFVTRKVNNVLAVPDNFVKSEKDKNYVWQKVNGKKVKTKIIIGDDIDGDIIVTSGLKEGDIVYD